MAPICLAVVSSVVVIAVLMVDVVVVMVVVPTVLCVELGSRRRQRARARAATAGGVGGIAQIVEDQNRHAARRELSPHAPCRLWSRLAESCRSPPPCAATSS